MGNFSPRDISGLVGWWDASNLSLPSKTPSQISGLVGWWDFSDASTLYTDAGTTLVSADGDAIYQANDKSGNGSHFTQSTAANRPLYKTGIKAGRSVARFDGANDIMATPDVAALRLTGGLTIITVLKAGAVQNYQYLNKYNGAFQGWSVAVNGASGELGFYTDGGGWDNPTGDATQQWLTHTVTDTAAGAANQYKTGVHGLTTAAATITSATNELELGGTAVGAGARFTGDIAEVLIFSAVLSDADRIAVEKYLCDKWGIAYAAVPSADNDSVAVWPDLSGNNNHLTMDTAASQPLFKTAILNSRPAMLFDNTDDQLSLTAFASGTLSQPMTYFLVAKLVAVHPSGYQFIVDGQATGRSTIYVNPSLTWGLYAGTESNAAGAADTNNHLFAALFDGASSKLWVDGGSGVTGNPGATAMDGVRMGYNPVSPGNCYVEEFIVYDAGLTTADVNRVGRYLSAKYGLTWTAAT